MPPSYDLEILEDFILHLIPPKRISAELPDAETMLYFEQLVIDETQRIKKRMKATVSEPGEEREKERYIQRNQKDIIALKNALVNYLKPQSAEHLQINGDDDVVVRLCKHSFEHLKELAECIEESFAAYFNLDEMVPFSYLLRSRQFLKDQQKLLQRKLRTANDKQIVQLINSCIQKLITSNSPVTYRRLLYIKNVVKELNELPMGKTNGKLASPFLEFIIYVNFNCGKVSCRLIEAMANELNTIHDQRERISWLYAKVKQINQLPVKPGMTLLGESPTLREQIQSWINEEIIYLEKKGRLFSMPAPADVGMADEDKIQFMVPEPVLSMLVRSAMESKLIGNKVKKDVYEKVARIVTTPGSRNPKPGSLLKKGYDPERSHQGKAIEILHDMIR